MDSFRHHVSVRIFIPVTDTDNFQSFPWTCALHLYLLVFFSTSLEDYTINGTEMADVQQTQKMIPFITCKISLCQYVCELVLGVDVFDLDLGILIDSIKQPIKSNSARSGNMSH